MRSILLSDSSATPLTPHAKAIFSATRGSGSDKECLFGGEKQMTINCFAVPVEGLLPIRHMRFNCSSVASEIFKKPICESGIYFTLFPTRLPHADETNRFFLMVRSLYRIGHEWGTFRERAPSLGEKCRELLLLNQLQRRAQLRS